MRVFDTKLCKYFSSMHKLTEDAVMIGIQGHGTAAKKSVTETEVLGRLCKKNKHKDMQKQR